MLRQKHISKIPTKITEWHGVQMLGFICNLHLLGLLLEVLISFFLVKHLLTIVNLEKAHGFCFSCEFFNLNIRPNHASMLNMLSLEGGR